MDAEATLILNFLNSYGNFFPGHLACMGKYLFATTALLSVFSCTDTLEKQESIIAPSSSIRFTCNYSEYKTISKTLFIRYKKQPVSFNKQLLLNNIRDSLFTCWLTSNLLYFVHRTKQINFSSLYFFAFKSLSLLLPLFKNFSIINFKKTVYRNFFNQLKPIFI